MTDEELFDLSDDELEAQFKEAKAEMQSPEDGIEAEEEIVEEEIVEEETIEEEEEEEVDDLEQPEEDSDDDTSSDEVDEDEVDEDSETEEGELDGDPETEEEQPEETKEADTEDEQPAPMEKLAFKANGQDYEFTVDEMKQQFGKVFGQAMDYTKKTQQMKPWRKTIDAIEQAELSQTDVNLMIDVLKGDKDAIANVLKRTGVDALDLDVEDSSYVAKDYGRTDTELAIKDIVDEISSDKEYSITHNVLEKQWDSKSRDEFVSDPSLIKLLHTDVKSGMFDKVSPIANKLKVYDGAKGSDLDYYKQAAQQYFNSQAQDDARATAQEEANVAKESRRVESEKIASVKAKAATQKATKQASTKRKAAAPSSKKIAGTKGSTDFLDDSDEGFEDWYDKLQDSM
jgi:hypothetical protein